jgi:hypothetical protein
MRSLKWRKKMGQTILQNMKPKKTMCCNDCGSDDIEWRVWADENNKVSRTCEDKFIYCNDCEENKTWKNK